MGDGATGTGFSGGSGGAGGYRFQALACAYVSAHALAGHPLNWIGTMDAVPLAVWAETGGPGDDLRAELLAGGDLEVQAKRGLRRGKELLVAVERLGRGLAADASLRCVLLVNTSASAPVREHLTRDLSRASMGVRGGMRPLTLEVFARLRGAGVPTDAGLIGRLSVAVADLGDGSEGEGAALALLAGVVDKPRIRDAWAALKDDGMRLAEVRGRRDVPALRALLQAQGIPARDPAEDAGYPAASARGEDAVPPVPSPFVGRDPVVASLSRLLGDGAEPVTEGAVGAPPAAVALFGLPGSGKTAVASAVAENLRGSFDIVLWASLGPHPSVLAELSAWGRQLGDRDLADSLNAAHASRRLRNLLRGERVLLVVDDAWEAAHAAPFAAAHPGCAVLFTTRSPALAAELAAGGRVEELEALGGDGSLELLKTLAPAASAQGSDPQQSAALEGLAADLGGLPLALRVAGRLLQSEARMGLGLAETIEDLRRGDGLLDARAPADLAETVGEAAPTVAALLSRSTDALPAPERDRFARLAPFSAKPASFDLRAAEEVWGVGAGDVGDARGALLALTGAGLVEPDGAGRFAMHPVIRMHARRLLAGTADGGRGVSALHAGRYLAMLRSANTLFAAGRRGREEAARLFDAEWANVRDAQRWASSRVAALVARPEEAGGVQSADRTPSGSLDAEADRLILDYAEAAGEWIARRADLPERTRWLEDAVGASQRLAASAKPDIRPTVADGGREENGVRTSSSYRASEASLLFALGMTRFLAGNRAEALGLLGRSRDLCAELGDRLGEAKALGATAVVYQRRGDYEGAEGRFREALEVLDRVPNTPPADETPEEGERRARGRGRQRGVVLGNLGTLYKNMGKREEAAEKNREALYTFRDIRDPGQIGASLNNLAALRSELFGDPPGARRTFSAALHLFRSLRDRHGESISLLGLARELANAGDHAEAEERARELVDVCVELGDLSTRGWALSVMGSARLGLDDPTGSAERHREALALSEDTQDKRLWIMARMGLGRAALADDDPVGALAHFEKGLESARQTPVPMMVGQLLFDKARALEADGRDDEALRAAEQAAGSRRELGAPEISGAREWLDERRGTGDGGIGKVR